MLRSFVKTLLLGITSGAALSAGKWLWKNCFEGVANEMKQHYESSRKESKAGGD